MEQKDLRSLLNERSDLREYLFPRGFLLTNDTEVNISDYPFYDLWYEEKLFGYRFFVHKKQKFTKFLKGNKAFVLVGHSYEPVVSLEYREEILLQKLAELYECGEKEYTDFFNLWTGSFSLFIFDESNLLIYGDPAGMQMVTYGFNNGKFYAASHTKLLGDVCGLEMDEYVKRLINYRFYKLFGKTLPGEISPYKNFKRVIPNHYIKITNGTIETNRFFPTDDNGLSDSPYEEIIEKAGSILKNSMGLIHKKWDRPAISLTGGCDSKTTLSCTKDNYNNYLYFSYTSQETETVDAVAAKSICDLLGIPHKTYEISSNDENFNDLDIFREILAYNSGNIGNPNSNDVRKRIFFAGTDDFDVEVKSWVSEIGRAYYHKRFAKKKFPQKLKPRYATTLYKVFLSDRKLIKDTDEIFAQYLDKYYTDAVFDSIPWYDLFFWEFRVSSWNGLVITGEQQLSYDITIPYNNRELLRLLLSTPVKFRTNDTPHFDIMRLMNPDIYNCNISVTNVKHTQKRAKAERLYLDIYSKLPY